MNSHICAQDLLTGLILLCLTAILAGTRADAQQPDSAQPPAASQPDAKTYSVSGTVVDSLTGEPIRRAAIAVAGANNRAGQTDNSGHFEFDGLTAGPAFISAHKPGYTDGTQFPYTGMPYGIGLQVGHDSSPVLLKLAPAGAIVGRLTGPNDRPLEGFRLHVLARVTLNGKRQWQNLAFSGMTDEDGNFRIADLPAGTYYLAVDQNQQTMLSQRGVPNAREQGYPQVFYPGVAELGAAAPIELSPGREVEANLSLAPELLYQISGSLDAHDGLPYALSFMREAGEGYDFTLNASLDTSGKIQAKLPAGSYRVTGFNATGVELSNAGAPAVVSSDSSDLRVILSVTPSIPIEVRTETSAESGATAQPAQGAGPPVNVVLVPDSRYPANPRFSNGPLGIQNVEPGNYVVQVNMNQGQWWIKSMRSGSVDLLSDDLAVTAGAQPPPIEITLRNDAGSMRGTVASAEDWQNVLVLLVQLRGRRNLIRAAAAVQGAFQFDAVAPGDYFLLAFDNAELEYENPEVLNPYLSKAEHISVQPHATANVNLTLLPLGR